MASQFAFFFMRAGEASCDDLNQFMKSHKIIRVTDNFVSDGANSGYHFLVEYAQNEGAENSKKARVDYRAMLKTDSEKELFDKLKELRSAICKKEKLVGAYIVCKDEHLYAMVQNPKMTQEEIAALPHSGNIKIADLAPTFF